MQDLPQPTKEMVEYFEKRTNEHIERVRDNMMGLTLFVFL